jgi:pyruvate/2-oxoglutarate dehydrogenase complex dihydrolipoamide acyltransferase (E2) component
MLTLPQVGILALAAAHEVGGEQAMKATFVGDHRAIDGAVGARFLAVLADSLQSSPATKGTR